MAFDVARIFWARKLARLSIASLPLGMLVMPAHAELILGVHTEEPASAIAEVLATLAPGGERLRIQGFVNASELTAALETGDIDLALLEEPNAPLENLRLVAELYPNVLHVLHRGERASTIAEVLSRGKIWAGGAGGAGERLVMALIQDYGLDQDQVELLGDPFSSEPDVYIAFGGILAPDALARLAGFTLFSFDDPANLMHGSAAEGAALRYPNLRAFLLPAQLYPSLQDQPVLTLAVSTLLVAHSSLDARLVYQLATAVNQAQPMLTAVYPLAGVEPLARNARAARTLPLHPGAKQFVDRDQPTMLERYAEVLALGVTMLIAITSAALAWQRRRRQARKDRLDGYYQRLLAQRPGIGASAEARAAARKEIAAIQAEVFELVVDERIDTDGALLAFLALSNQLLTESTNEPS